MTTKQLTPILLFIILSLNLFSQKVSLDNEPLLLKTWKETYHFLKTKDTTGLRGVCLDSIEFSYSNLGANMTTRKVRSFSSFIKNELDSLVHDKSFWKVTSRKKPYLMKATVYDKYANEYTIYSIEYRFRNPNRGKKRYKYKQFIVFTYVFQNGTFKLFGIGDSAYVCLQTNLNFHS
jgi:hypothetical protein